MRASWLARRAPGSGRLGRPARQRPGDAAVSQAGPGAFSVPRVRQVAQAIGPSVVRLEVSGDREDSTASGVIIDTRGNVVTSSHLFDGWTPPAGAEAEAIAIVLVDGRRLSAELRRSGRRE